MIEIDASALDRAEQFLRGIPGAAKKAATTAAKKTIRGSKKDAVQKVRERYTIKPVYISRTISLSANLSSMSFRLQSKGRVNDLAYFKHTPGSVSKRRLPRGKYLYSQVVKGEGGTIAHAFLARMKSSHIGVFQRAEHGASNASLPIKKLAGPSTPQMLGSPTVSAFIQKRIEERLAKDVEHEVNAFLMGYRT